MKVGSSVVDVAIGGRLFFYFSVCVCVSVIGGWCDRLRGRRTLFAPSNPQIEATKSLPMAGLGQQLIGAVLARSG